jgi:ketosteroid isomerase-like protein
MQRDAAALASLFAQDAVYVSATGDAYAGQASIRDYYARTFATLDYARSVAVIGEYVRENKVLQVQPIGDDAWAFGRGRLLVNAPHGLVARTDHWVAIFARQGGEWKIRLLSIGEDVQPPPLR